MNSVVRSTALRAGGACVRCRKGKTKCVYENGRAPCKNCAKGMHECYLPSESMAHGGHGVSPARHQRPRESLPGERASGSADRTVAATTAAPRHVQTTNEKLTPELLTECERVINKTLPSCVAFHKPSCLQQLKNLSLEPSLVNSLLCAAARSSPFLLRRYSSQNGATGAAEHFSTKAINLIMSGLDQPCLADIQALCLLVIHEWGSRNAVRAYIYLGQAARMAQMYRIVAAHVNQPEPEQFLNAESFRRVLWLIYILDCFLTASPGRHPALSSHDVKDVSLPCQDMNYHFGSPCFVRTLSGAAPSTALDPNAPLSDIGEFGHIVLATQAWRNVVEMLTTVTPETFSEEQCVVLEQEVEAIRSALPSHFLDKPGQINLHITMGSGYTYAMIHCLLHCATIFINRRRILQLVTQENFSQDTWRLSHNNVQTVDRIFAASHCIMAMLTALDNNGATDKDSLLVFPIFMLFSAFTASSTVAYLSLKGLTPANVSETSTHIVRDGSRFMSDGADAWPLVIPWNRHLTVMAKVLRESESVRNSSAPPAPSSVKDETASQADTNPDAMDYDQPQPAPASLPPPDSGRGSEPPIPRRPGVTTINGSSAGASTPASGTPPPGIQQAKPESPDPASSASGAGASNAGQPSVQDVDMTSMELCTAFERQLLELDDLAAFMGGDLDKPQLLNSTGCVDSNRTGDCEQITPPQQRMPMYSTLIKLHIGV